MIVFVDTEFTDHQRPKLISAGLVTEDGRHECYAETNDFATAECSDFVREFVLPLLAGGSVASSKKTLGRRVVAWLARVRTGQDVVILVDYATDWYLLAEAIAEVPNWLSAQATSAISGLALETYFERPGVQRHHALHDARALRHAWIAAGGRPEDVAS